MNPIIRPGVFVPVITPFTRNGRIDFKSLGKHFEYLLSNGVHGIVVGGTTGEGHALSVEEKKRLIDYAVFWREKTGRKFTIIAGTGTQKIREAIEVAKHAMKKKCEAVLALPPRRASQETTEKFYIKLGNNANIPIIAYNIPHVSGTAIKPGTIARLLGKSWVIGIKDSSGNKRLLREWKRKSPKALVFVGEDKLIEYGVKQGKAHGTIPGTGNVAPRQLVAAFRQARKDYGTKAQQHVNRIVDELLSTGNFGGAIKAILRARHLIKSENRKTGRKLSKTQRKKLLERRYRRA